MKVFHLRIIFTVLFITIVTFLISADNNEIPHLIFRNNAIKLLVDAKPFLMLDGKLGNSSAASSNEVSQI